GLVLFHRRLRARVRARGLRHRVPPRAAAGSERAAHHPRPAPADLPDAPTVQARLTPRSNPDGRDIVTMAVNSCAGQIRRPPRKRASSARHNGETKIARTTA